MASDAHARLREVLGLGAGVILSEDEIAKGLKLLAAPEADAIRAALAPPAAAPPKRFVFGGVPR